MGTKVQCESYMPGYFSMRDLNEDSNSCSWPLFYGDRAFPNGHYSDGFMPRASTDAYPGYDKDSVKQTMLEHEAIFKDQLHELHRLYRIQKDLMNEVKRKEILKNSIPIETSLSSSPLASQVTSEDARRWQFSSFALANSAIARSTSGIEDIHSPLSSMKGSSAQASPLPSQNGGTSKDVEILESRPTKVRRKMFDLQLPADEYIDTEEGEQLKNVNAFGVSSYLPNKDKLDVPQNGINLFLGKGEKNKCQGDSLRSESCLRSTNNLADLNEPVEVEASNPTAYVDLVGCSSSHGESQGHKHVAVPKSQVVGLSQEISSGSHRGSDNGFFNNPYLQTRGKQWFPNILDSGHGKGNLNSIAQGLQPEKLPGYCRSMQDPIQDLFNKTHEHRSLFQADHNKADQLRGRPIPGLELSEKNLDISNTNRPDKTIASFVSGPYPIAPTSDLGKSWSHSASSWEQPSGSLSQKSMSVQMHPYLNSSALSRSSQSSNHSHGIFSDRWNYNSNSASNSGFGSEMPNRNGFYKGSSSSGYKELLVQLPLSNYNCLNSNTANSVASECFMNNGSLKFYNSTNCKELKSDRDTDLNALLYRSSSGKAAASQQVLEVIDLEKKDEEHPTALPWLRPKPTCKNEVINGGIDLNTEESSFLRPSLNHLPRKDEFGKGSNDIVSQNRNSASCSVVAEGIRVEVSDSSSSRKILGFPIFEKVHISRNESVSFTSPSVPLTWPSGAEVENNKKHRVLDINLPCDLAVPDSSQQTAAEVVVVEKQTEKKVSSFRHEIDLNSCACEEEASLVPPATGSIVKISAGIDLEVPAVPENEEDAIPGEECIGKVHEASVQLPPHKVESPENESIRMAAEAILAISSSCQQIHFDDATGCPSGASMTDPLLWFVDIVSSCGEDLESKLDAVSRAKDGEENRESSTEEIDYFEAMILQLEEIKEEDYMPKPLVPENLILEDTGTTPLTTRTRKGPGRRGRQRRDFQRDILPGLASLSRHEVTEDLQTFGGLMRATGHPWHSGLTRRTSTRGGCGRGRRRTVASTPPAAVVVTVSPPCTPLVQQVNNVEVGLEERSLTGWGKTTRRPRRQRCPAGNPPAVALT